MVLSIFLFLHAGLQLRAILEDILMQCMFDAPSESGIAKVIVNAACVQEHKQPLMLNQDGAPVGESA